jgi:molybdopterin synthase sulfur carrier subunit
MVAVLGGTENLSNSRTLSIHLPFHANSRSNAIMTTANKSQREEGLCTVLFFAAASTYTTQESTTLRGGVSLRQLLADLETKFPGFTSKIISGSAITVNLEYVDFNVDELSKGNAADEKDAADGLGMIVQPGDEVGIIPPVSSG